MAAALPPADLNAAFQAVWGKPPPVVVEARARDGHKEQLYARPVLLTPMGRGRYVLATKESNGMLAHMDGGAVSVAYVTRQADGWRTLGSWREAAWAGENGGEDVTVTVRRDLGARPLLFLRGMFLAQGDDEESAAVLRLDPERPVALGVLPLGGDNTGAGYPDQESFSYQARIVPAHGALFAVRYEGWTAPAFQKPRRPFRRTIAYRIDRGCLAPLGRLAIPAAADFDLRYGCAAASRPSPAPAGRAARTGRAPEG